ncbi:AMP-binding protein [Parabacteroides sp. FAFU027]|uniref:AMP-binding protein n=1 Tax=Parabacteroides sp. FAFU027 TaxID=2922715 RepID=UPI001FAF9EF5|nr:AMP-binding protein [Parabacteroides sp. FAFU027]
MQLTINQTTYSREQFPALIEEKKQQQLPEWEAAFFAFLEKWMDNNDTVPGQTSGSTGTPKNIALSKQSMMASARLTNDYFKLKEGDTISMSLSANYIAGKMMIVRAWISNLHLIVCEPASMPEIPQRVKFGAMVPMQVEKLMSSESGREALEQIEILIIGGSAIPYALEQRLKEISTVCYCTYGMTETVSHIALRRINGSEASEEYFALGNVRFELDERGCLVIFAPHLQAEPFVTNDLVELSSPYRFRWMGRFDNVINSGGIKLFPETIEQKLSPAIPQRFFLTALSDEILGQKLALVIEGELYTEAETLILQEYISNYLSKYEKPRQIIFKKRFNETSTGKVKREI